LNVKKLLSLALLAAVLLAGTPAHAQVFGQFQTAEILPVNTRMGGAYVDFSSNAAGLTGQLRLSFYPNVDFGFQGGIVRYDVGSDTRSVLRLGADLRFGVRKADEQFPLDIAVGGGLGVLSGDNYNVLLLGPTVVASHAFPFTSTSAVVPFAGAMLSFANVDVGPTSDTDISLPLRLGAELRTMPGVRLVGEVDIKIADDYDNHSVFVLGVNMPF
jgi:hypothetical protein